VVEASAVHAEKPSWYGTCAICMDLLPDDPGGRTVYACCCKKICSDCSDKCNEYDTRCPFCRAPAPTAAEYLRRMQKHADEGNAEAQYQLGTENRLGNIGLKKSYKRAVPFYKLAAAQGHVCAQQTLGHCYESGHGVKIDYKMALHWLRRAADQGLPLAQLNLGAMIYQGKGVAQSHDEAARWFRLAAAQGEAQALYVFGECYANGHGVPQDNNEALRLCTLAVAKGCAAAGELKARLLSSLDLAERLDEVKARYEALKLEAQALTAHLEAQALKARLEAQTPTAHLEAQALTAHSEAHALKVHLEAQELKARLEALEAISGRTT
jgi:TPR repeat protein